MWKSCLLVVGCALAGGYIATRAATPERMAAGLVGTLIVAAVIAYAIGEER